LILTPKAHAAEAARAMGRAGNAATAASSRSFFKPGDRVSFHGITTPRLREIERRLFQQVKEQWHVKEAVVFCRLCLASRFNESKTLGILTLSRFHREFERGLFSEVERWLSGDLCDNWSAVDALAPWVITPLLRRHPGLMPRLARWTRSRNLWVRRASVVCLVPMARRGEHLELAYGTAETLAGDREDLIHKAVGWLLREAGKTDPRRLEAFLLTCRPRMPRTTMRYAIERMPRDQRLRLMAATRA
jgi:3-methyladenine DNA glycosylase AlkD